MQFIHAHARALARDEPYHITIEIVNKGCKGLRILRDLEIQQYTLDDVRGLLGGSTRHLIRMPSKEITEIHREIFTKIRGSDKFGGEASALFDSDGCDVCRAILSNDSFLVSGRHVNDYTIVYSFVTSNFDAFKNIVLTLEVNGLEPKILEVRKFKPRGKVLTEKQERVCC